MKKNGQKRDEKRVRKKKRKIYMYIIMKKKTVKINRQTSKEVKRI